MKEQKYELLPNYISSPSLLELGAGSSTSQLKKFRCKFIALLLAAFLCTAIIWHSGSRKQWMKGSKGLYYDLPNDYGGTFPSTSINSTFGFQKAYVISLPSRIDYRDSLYVMRQVSGVDFEIIDGVYGTDVVKDRMGYWDPNHVKPGALGCYRSHIKVWKKMLEEKIESAFIMEEDVDWVEDITSALQRLQHPFASLLTSLKKDGIKRSLKADDPWNHKDWDVLHLSSCQEKAFTQNNARSWTSIYQETDFWQRSPYLTYADVNVPDASTLLQGTRSFFGDYNLPLYENSTDRSGDGQMRSRVVTRSLEPWCTGGYALTIDGAAKLLYSASITMNEPVDVAMGFSIQDLLIESYTVVPPLFGEWKVSNQRGLSDRESIDQQIATFQGGNKYDPWQGTATNLGKTFRQQIKKKFTVSECDRLSSCGPFPISPSR